MAEILDLLYPGSLADGPGFPSYVRDYPATYAERARVRDLAFKSPFMFHQRTIQHYQDLFTAGAFPEVVEKLPVTPIFYSASVSDRQGFKHLDHATLRSEHGVIWFSEYLQAPNGDMDHEELAWQIGVPYAEFKRELEKYFPAEKVGKFLLVGWNLKELFETMPGLTIDPRYLVDIGIAIAPNSIGHSKLDSLFRRFVTSGLKGIQDSNETKTRLISEIWEYQRGAILHGIRQSTRSGTYLADLCYILQSEIVVPSQPSCPSWDHICSLGCHFKVADTWEKTSLGKRRHELRCSAASQATRPQKAVRLPSGPEDHPERDYSICSAIAASEDIPI